MIQYDEELWDLAEEHIRDEWIYGCSFMDRISVSQMAEATREKYEELLEGRKDQAK